MEDLLAFACLSENETIVRTYRCTSLRQLFRKPVIGYLSITNKRLVYHSENKSANSDSSVLAEIPLEDVGSISTIIGSSINLLYFLALSAVFYIVTIVLKSLFPGVLTGLGISVVLLLPYLIGLMFEKNIINQDLSERILQNLEGSAVDSVVRNANWRSMMKIFRYLFLVGMPLFAYNVAYETNFGRQTFPLRFILLMIAYFLIYMLISGRQRAFGLQVRSRSSSNSGILIHGNAFLALFNKSNTASRTLSAAPAEDAEIVAKELGALVMDIQQLGDFGIEKWSRI
jgi:hypothetical protein